MKRFGNQVRYAPILAGVLIALAVLFSHAYGISARTHDGAHANLSAEVVDGGVLLSWKAPLAGEVTAYRILRRYGSESAELGVLVEDTGSALTRYVDSSARPGTEYVYRVQPIGSDGVGARSKYARLKTPAFAPGTSASAGEPLLDDLPPLLPPADASDATRGFSLLRGTESTTPYSLEVTAGAFWVGARIDHKIYIFERSGSSVTYDSSLDITLKINDTGSIGMWSNGVTMWVSDSVDRKLYAYTIATRTRDSDKDFTLHSDNGHARGIWSDDTTMWVADDDDYKLYAYTFSDQQRDSDKDIGLNSDNAEPGAITSDGATMWVADIVDDIVYAYVLSPQAGETFGDRVTDREPELDSDNDQVYSVAYEAGYLYVGNRHDDIAVDPPHSKNRVYAYAVGDARLSDITVDGSSIPAFSAADTGPQHGVASGTAQVTVAATAVFSGSTVNITSPGDADAVADGHQVNLSAGANAVTIEVAAADGLATKTYNLGINRGVNSQYGWAAHHDIDTLKLGGNRDPRGIWANSGNFYIADFQLEKIYAYNRDGARDSTKDIDTSTFSNGIWSDGTTLWVAYSASSTLSAYTLAGGSRDNSADITLGASSRGVWGNSTTIWAVNEETDKLEAYQRSDGTDDDDKDISLDTLNANPAGIWSDDTTMWVADHINDKLYAYALSGGARDTTKDLDTSGSGNANPRGLWGNEETLWVTDRDDNKVYSYNLQFPPVAAPMKLVAEGRGRDRQAGLMWDDPGDSTITKYQYRVSADGGTSWNPNWTDIPGSDASTTSYTVTGLSDGTAHTIEVRAVNPSVDGTASSVTVTPVRFSDATRSFSIVRDTASTAPDALEVTSGAFWVASNKDDKTFGFERASTGVTYDSTLDIPFGPGQTRATGMWTDGTTIWVAEEPLAGTNPQKLFAYTISTRARDGDKDFATIDTVHNEKVGVWSNGTTIWIGDTSSRRVVAYDFRAGTRDAERDFGLLADNVKPAGLASDGRTMWVSDPILDKIFAYVLSPGAGETFGQRVTAREPELDFANDVPRGIVYESGYLYVGNWHNDADSDPPHPRNRVFAYAVESVSAPAAPASFRAVGRDVEAVLSWDDPGDLSITKYQYRVSADGGSTWNPDWGDIPSSGAGTTGYSVTSGLSNGVEYTFEVRAVNPEGDGDESRATTTPSQRPAAPANLAADPGDAQVALSWDDPGDSTITKYQYRVSADGGINWDPNWGDIPSSGAGTTGYSVTSGLSNRVEYTFEVRAVNPRGNGDESRATTTPAPLPAAPANLKGTSGPDFFEVTLTWNNPGDSSITKYQIRISADVGSTWNPDWMDIPGSGPNTARHVLAFGGTEERTFELRAVNSRGEGPASTTTEIPRDYPAPVAPRNFGATPGVSQVTLTWSDPGDILITNYQYRVSADGSSWVPDWTDIPSSGASTTSYTVTGLTNDTEYTFEVRAQNKCTTLCAYQGNGEASRDVATPEDVPDIAPPVIQALAVNGVTLTLTYDEPLRDSVTPATTAFSVRVGSATVLVNRVNISGATVTLTLATAAENGQSVRLTYSKPALSPIQDPSGNKAARLSNRNVTNNTPPPTAPDAPDALTASPQGQNQINLSWDAPADNGGARITGYKIEVSEDGGSTWDDLEDNTRNADTTYSHIGLNLGTTRHYRVSAINRIGTSVPSAVEAATTDARPAVTLRASQISGEYFEYGGGRVPAYSIFIEFSQPVEDVTENSICNGLTLTNARLRFCNADVLPSQNKPVIGTARPWLTTWRADIWPRAPETGGDITVTASLAANVARDASGRLNRASPPLSFTVRNLPASDTREPSVRFIFRDSLPTVFTGPLDVFVSFFEETPTSARQAEAVTGFTQSDVRVRGGRVTAFTPQTDAPAGHRYLVTIRPNEPSGRVLDSNAPWNLDDVTEMQISLSANAVQDAAGNRNEATESATFVARPRPTVTLSLPTETIDGYEYLANPSDAFNVTVTFSESVTGFTQNELRVSGARVGGPHGVEASGAATVTGWDARSNGREYVATITPTRVGTIELSVSAGAATDSDGYRNLQSPSRKITLSGVP